MVKLKEIAERLELGVSTVSAVLNGKDYCYVSALKKKLIRDTAEEMGYIPNRMSRGMKGLPTQTIGIIASLFTVPIQGRLIYSLNMELAKAGYSALLGDSKSQMKDEKAIIGEFLSRGIDGILIQTTYSRTELEALFHDHIPYVVINREFDGTSVTVDRAQGVFMAVEHLATVHKRRKIGFVSDGSLTNQRKTEGYRSAVKKIGMQYGGDYIIEIPDYIENARGMAERVAELGLDAVSASNDVVAGLLIKNLRRMGKRIPEDVAVIGFDGIDYLCEMTEPSLTSVRQPMEQVAEKAVELLLAQIKGEKVPEKMSCIKPVLKIGESCGCGKGATK
ncbi:MAG: hypothetical protein A2020_12410 [Lentisphaerae bacterium GWF2_45_14]|nr:MAG: hypothetical protein A2020_12410 [Lentisphaerae bacterium GWF2_45_14]